MNYRAELNQLIIVANNTLKHSTTRTIFLDHQISVGYRLYWQDLSSGAIKFGELSPRMSLKNLCNWINGFISGLDF